MSKVVPSVTEEPELTLAELSRQMKIMQKELKNKDKTINMLLKKEGMPPSNNDVSDGEEVPEGTRVKVMNLCPTGHELNLVTRNRADKAFNFRTFGEVKNIRYSMVVEIIEVNRSFLEQGKFIILNPKVVRIHGLEDIYSKILTKEKIEEILLGNNQSDMVNLFKSAPVEQEEFIVQMFVNKLVSGEKVDLNLLDRIDRIYCYDSNNEKVKSTISERSQEITALLEIQKKQQAS